MNREGKRFIGITLVCCMLLASGCASVQAPVPAVPVAGVATPAAAHPPMTLPRFLGLDVLVYGVARGAQATRIKLASRFPALQKEAKKPPTTVGDPANLQSPSPTVAGAAAIQQAKADAPAKKQALAYLATLDCGAYPQIEESYLAALDDVAEEVRVAAIEAILASKDNCGACGSDCTSCCTPALRARLHEMVTCMSDDGCYLEPSPKVRRLARIALGACGGSVVAIQNVPEELPSAEALQLLEAPVAL